MNVKVFRKEGVLHASHISRSSGEYHEITHIDGTTSHQLINPLKYGEWIAEGENSPYTLIGFIDMTSRFDYPSDLYL